LKKIAQQTTITVPASAATDQMIMRAPRDMLQVCRCPGRRVTTVGD
jgi:hypothetical protein